MSETPRVYTVHEIAQILQMHEETVRTLLRAGRLKGIKLGPHATLPGRFEWRVTDRALRQFLELDQERDAAERATTAPKRNDDG